MEQQQDLLLELEQEVTLDKASRGLRFANYLIDGIAIRIVRWAATTAFAFLNIQNILGWDTEMALRENPYAMAVVVYLYSYILYTMYDVAFYTFMEGITKGRTLGKLMTRTRAMRADGGEITWKDALIRSLCRVVPFEAFSGFGTPWHDTWSKTQVVKMTK